MISNKKGRIGINTLEKNNAKEEMMQLEREDIMKKEAVRETTHKIKNKSNK